MNPNYKDSGMNARIEVLYSSLILEGYVAELLAELLGIKSRLESKTLGNSSSSLSFNTKIDLLIDIGALSGDKKKMFQLFMEIRNQFMHNYLAKSYTSLFEQIDGGKKTFLLKQFPQNETLPMELQLEYATRDLVAEVIKSTDEIKHAVENKRMQSIQTMHGQKLMEALAKSVDKMEEHINTMMSRIDWGNEGLQQRMNTIGSTCSSLINKFWEEEIEKYFNASDQ